MSPSGPIDAVSEAACCAAWSSWGQRESNDLVFAVRDQQGRNDAEQKRCGQQAEEHGHEVSIELSNPYIMPSDGGAAYLICHMEYLVG